MSKNKEFTVAPRGLTIIPKCDLEEAWLEVNPILKDREIVVSVDKNEIGYKLGDGKSCYSDLPFVDLFKAINLGYVYVRQPAACERVKFQLINQSLFGYLKDSGYTTIWDKQGNIVIKD